MMLYSVKIMVFYKYLQYLVGLPYSKKENEQTEACLVMYHTK